MHHRFFFITAMIVWCVTVSGSFLFAQKVQADDVVGIWFRDQAHDTAKAKFEIYRTSDGKYEGKLIWGGSPTFESQVDKKNPDVSKRTRPLKNMVFLTDFIFDGDDEWTGGRIYNAEDGDLYKCKMELEDNKQTLKVRGYVGIPLLGKTERWHRLK
jgi:uncharacterized protein (DUF2147 family)